MCMYTGECMHTARIPSSPKQASLPPPSSLVARPMEDLRQCVFKAKCRPGRNFEYVCHCKGGWGCRVYEYMFVIARGLRVRTFLF